MFKQGAFKRLLTQIFQDVDGIFSSKRVVAFIGLGIMIIAFVADLVFQSTVTDYIFDGFLVLTLGSLGITGIEHFAKRPAATKVDQSTNVDVNVGGGTPSSEE